MIIVQSPVTNNKHTEEDDCRIRTNLEIRNYKLHRMNNTFRNKSADNSLTREHLCAYEHT